MRIALVSDSVYPFNKGGKETRSFGLAKKLAEGHKVDFYTMNFWKGKDVLIEGVRFRALSRRFDLYAGGRRSFVQGLWFGLASFKMLFRDFDVLDADHMVYFHLFPLWLVCKLKKKRFVATWHEVWGLDLWRKYLGVFGFFGYLLERISAKLPDRIVSVSKQTSERLEKMGVKKDRIYTIPNAVDFEGIQGVEKAGFASDVVFVGRLVKHKRVDLILKAVSLLKEEFPRIRFLIVGDGSERKRLERMVFDLGIEGNVFFKGVVDSDEEVFSLLKSSRVFVLASEREGFGIVVLEANACGVPVICTNQKDNAARHLIEEGKNGFVCRADAESLAEGIRKALKARGLEKFCLDKAKRYDWNFVASKFEEVYFS